MNSFAFHPGTTPLLISMPHNGAAIPEDIAAVMQPHACVSDDTDWYMDRLYDFAAKLGIGVINPTYSRYVIDLNRAPDGAILYAGANNTELCPTTAFDLSPLYLPGQEPDQLEVERRIETYWRPYHTQLAAELARLKNKFGYALLYDAHSIRSEVPRFFDGRLWDLNLGTADGASCARELQNRLADVALSARDYTAVVNGRFKGGYITRHYGQPEQGVHAVQLELSQITYLDEDSHHWREDKVAGIQPVLRRLVETMLEWRPAG
ncbi:MAG: N-formylglutamate deformylase [Gammaproteobacteria bacterium]|nr:N-formylglutamate deformylase [Gammaproteobacteria bacterium]